MTIFQHLLRPLQRKVLIFTVFEKFPEKLATFFTNECGYLIEHEKNNYRKEPLSLRGVALSFHYKATKDT